MTKVMRVLFTGAAMAAAWGLAVPADAQVPSTAAPTVPSAPAPAVRTAPTAAVVPAGPSTTLVPTAEEAAFVAHLNALRASEGLRPLRVDTRLTGLGRAWAAKMAADGDISHNMALPKVAPSTWLRLGENVGTGRSVDRIHRAFVGSPTHYRNLVGRYDSVGVGVVRVGERIYVAQQFMSSRNPLLLQAGWGRIPRF